MIKEYIRNFFDEINPEIVVQAPSRINLINPLDAVEGDFWMPAVAIEGKSNPLSAFVYIREISKGNKIKYFQLISDRDGNPRITLKQEKNLDIKIETIKKHFNSELKLIYASLYRIYITNSIFWERLEKANIEIGILSTIPRQSGLGGSSSIILAFLYGLAKFFNIINKTSELMHGDLPINRDILAEMCTKIEDKDLKITAGYSDRYVIARGGLSFTSYYGKLYHKEITQEPLAVYDRIDELYNIHKLPIIVCFSGSIHKSGNVHKKLRELYLKEEPNIINKYEELAKIAWKSRFSLMMKNWKQLGEYFRKNTTIMNEVMELAEFEYGIGLTNNILIKLIENHPKVYGVKLTGAGGGGSVFALTDPSSVDRLMKTWKRKLNEIIENKNLFENLFPKYPSEIRNDLKKAKFFQIKINKTGLKTI
jgi:galactokinase/mevalonate kinase-like predicted kinase